MPAFVILSMLSAYLFNPIPSPLVREPIIMAAADSQKVKAVHDLADRLKDEKLKVATTPQLAPYFTNREYYYNFLFDPAFYDQGFTEDDIIKNIDSYERADYVIIARSELADDQKILKMFHDHIQGNPKYHRIYDMNDLEVYTNSLNRKI